MHFINNQKNVEKKLLKKNSFKIFFIFITAKIFNNLSLYLIFNFSKIFSLPFSSEALQHDQNFENVLLLYLLNWKSSRKNSVEVYF